MIKVIYCFYISFLFFNITRAAEPMEYESRSSKQCDDVYQDLDKAEISRRKKLAKYYSAGVPKFWCVIKYNALERHKSIDKNSDKVSHEENTNLVNWLALPTVCLDTVTDSLTLKDLINFSQTCKNIHSSCEYSWRKLGKKMLDLSDLGVKKPIQSWRNSILWRLWGKARDGEKNPLKESELGKNQKNFCFVVLEEIENIFQKRDFSKTNWSYANLRKLKFEDCNFEDANFCGAKLHFVTFKNCKFKNASFHQARLNTVKFDNCKLPNSCFSFSRLGSLEFEKCSLEGTDFTQTIFSRDKFTDSDLSQANFSDAYMFYITFENIDFSNTFFKNSSAPGVQLENCIVNTIKCTEKYGEDVYELEEIWNS